MWELLKKLNKKEAKKKKNSILKTEKGKYKKTVNK